MDPKGYLYKGTLLWTLTTNGYKYITLNLLRTAERAKIPCRIVVVCGDKESYRFFRNEGFAALLYSEAKSTTEIGIARWGSPTFQRYNRMKLDILHQFAKNELVQKCIYLDGDIVLYRDFLPDIESRLNANPAALFFQCDHKDKGSCKEKDPEGCQNCCTGFIAWSHGADKGIFDVNAQPSKSWQEIHDDQVWVNKALQEKKVIYDTVPRELYPNGAYISTIGEYPEAYLLHFNHRVGNAKIAEIKRLGQWIIPY